MLSSVTRMVITFIGVAGAKAILEKTVETSDTAKEKTIAIAKGIEHIGSNFKAMHRTCRSIFYSPPSLGSLTLERAKTLIPTLSQCEAKEIKLAYSNYKDHFYKSAPSKLSKTVIDDALMLGVRDEDDQDRAKLILEYVFDPKTVNADLNTVCRNFIRKKLNIDFDLKQEEKQTLSCRR